MNNLVEFEKFKDFWDREPIVVIDSCSLLDLYRYAPNASRTILNNLKRCQNNIWIPAHVLEEYFENKATVIRGAHKKFENVSDEVQKIAKVVDQDITSKFHRYGKFKYPNVNILRVEIEEIISNLNEKARKFKDLISSEIIENNMVLKEDEVNSFIETLKELNQVGITFPLPQKIDIYREGEFRYSHLIPPGYEDRDKDSKDKTKLKKFGDLIIWKELLEKSKVVAKPFIFITDDEKEDWWELNVTPTPSGERVEILGARSELLSEFGAVSQIGENGFIMMNLVEFNKHISKINEAEVDFKELYFNTLELDKEKIVKDIISCKEWNLILDEYNLTSYLIHDGELQEFLDNILTDVEILEYMEPELFELYVDYDEDEVIIEGRFSCEVIVNIDVALSSEHSVNEEARLILDGNITIEFRLEYNEQENTYDRLDETVAVSSLKISEYTSINDDEDICINCFVRPGVYFTKSGDSICGNCIDKYDTCSGCGLLFEKGTLNGSKCSKCDD